MSRCDLYIDLDGVILRKTGGQGFNGRPEYEVAPHAMEFLAWCIDQFNCYWLTSRSHDGSYGGIERAFRHALPATNLPEDIRHLVRSIQPAPWGKAKIEGIDTARDFYWIDNSPDAASMLALRDLDMFDRSKLVFTNHRPDDLLRLRKVLEAL